MIAQSTFVGGMNQDLAKTKLQNSKYLDALDIRLITNEGQSTGSLTNIRGNKVAFTIPDTFAIYKITIGLSGFGIGTFTIAGQTSANFTPSASTTGQDIYNFLDADVALTSFGVDYLVAIAEKYIIIYSQMVNTNPSFSGSGLTSSTEVPIQTNLIPIGFTVLRDDIYLYTTPCVTKNPGGHDSTLSVDAISTGQIWKLTYNPITFATIPKLIYNNYLDFTTYRCIATTANLGIYENLDTQRGYWTDFNNQMRSCNFVDPNIMAVAPALFGVIPPVGFSIPTLNKVMTGGSITASVCQLAYRLKNTGGALTNFSELSNMVNIVPADETINTGGTNFKDYIGATMGTNCGKSIKWDIVDLDTNFDRVEFFVVQREQLGGTVSIIQFADEPIPTSGTMSIIYDGNVGLSVLTLTEFLSTVGAFTHCKTIGTKDNRLFASNLKKKYSDIDYDARAFRAKGNTAPTWNDIYLTNTGIQTIFNPTTAAASSQTSDAINDYTNVNAGYYKPGTGILGGAGTNISYEFGTIAVRADSIILTGGVAVTGADYRHTNPEYVVSAFDLDVKEIDNSTDQTYPTNIINDDIKYVYLSGLFKGYERSEIYRFAITFFDKQKNPIFAKWIGDIKMPNYDSVNNNPLFEDLTVAPHADFRASFVDVIHVATATAYVNQLFIKFTISIPAALSEIIDGYTICRVERTKENKTILGSGLLTQLYSDGGQFYLPDMQVIPTGILCYGPFPDLNIDDIGTTVGKSPDACFTFDCPEFLLGGYTGFQTGDKIQIIEKYNPSKATVVFGAGDPYIMEMLYTPTNEYSGTTHQRTLVEAGICEFADTYQYSLSSGFRFDNWTATTNGTSDALGAKTLCIGLQSSLSLPVTYGCTKASGDKIIAQYIRTLSSQYGGNTYSARSNNEYILCSHYRPIKQYNIATVDTFQLFGGDVYTQIYDNQKEIKNWGSPQSSRGTYTAPTIDTGCGESFNLPKTSMTFFFPCTSSHNTGLRHGFYVNHNLNDDNGSGAGLYETQDYNTVYSSENNIRKFFPKPTEFTIEEEFDTRTAYSAVKINGELTDSWGSFLPNDYWDVEGNYGPINAITPLGQNMMFWQDKAFGSLMINPLAVSTDPNGIVTILGSGEVIQRHNYASNAVGTKHQNSVIKSSLGVYWIDINTKKMYRITSDGLDCISETRGVQSFLNNFLKNQVITSDKPIYVANNLRSGIHGYFDAKYNEIVFTIFDIDPTLMDGVQLGRTLVFNEETQTFTGFYSYVPYIYIYDNVKFYSMDTINYKTNNPSGQQSLYIHDKNSNYGQFYGTYVDSYLKFLVNPAPSVHKIFDNLHMQTEEQTLDVYGNATDVASGITPIQNTFNILRITTDFQTTGSVPLVVDGNIARYERYWKTAIPKDTIGSQWSTFKPHMRDFYANVELWYVNSGKRLVIHDILTEYRLQGIPVSQQSEGQ